MRRFLLNEQELRVVLAGGVKTGEDEDKAEAI